SLGDAALGRIELLDRASLAEDDADFLEQVVPLAEAGRALLRGEPVDYEAIPSERVQPSPARIVQALRGDLSGAESGRLAARFLRRGDDLLRSAHRMRESTRAAEGPALRLAAAPVGEVRDPRE